MRLAGSVAIVTGASSGIGEATARELARRGASLALAARRAERLERLAAELEQATGRSHLVVPTDVTRRADVDRLVQATLKRFGRLDVLVNNAGTGAGDGMLSSSDEAIQRLLETNLLAPVRAVQAAVPHLHGGVIVNVGSVAGEGPGYGLYAVSKVALRAYSQGLRAQLGVRGIAVVLVEPGFIRTELTMRQRVRLPMPGPEVVGRAIARAVERPRATVIVPGWYLPLVWALRLTPGPLLDWGLRQAVRRLKAPAEE